MDEKRLAPPKDEWAHAEAVAAKASFDGLIQQLREAPGRPALQDRAKAKRGWSTFDRVLAAVAMWILCALAVVYVAYWRAPPTP
jgi:hypothetical protein